jgi:Leucine Rich repeat
MPGMDQPDTKRPRWLRFSLRMMFVVVTVLCVWLGFKVNAARRQKEAVAAILKSGGTVNYDYQLKPRSAASTPLVGRGFLYFSMFYADPKAPVPGPAWMRSQFGEDYFRTATQVYIQLHDPTAAKNAINELAKLSAVKCVQLRGYEVNRIVTDSDLSPLGSLQLERLWIVQTRATGAFFALSHNPASMIQLGIEENDIDDNAMEYISKMTNLENLNLSSNVRISDAGLEHVRNLTKLKVLNLDRTGVTDSGLKHLKGLTCLTYVGLSNTKATRDGIRELRSVLPNCTIPGP